MTRYAILVIVAGGFGLLAGCASDRPHDYGRERPPVGQIDERDKGLQSSDVVQSSDKVIEYMLALPDFNGPARKTVVVTNIENKTSNPEFNYDIFIQRLRTNMGQFGRDRLFLVENKERVGRLRNQEIETGGRDPFGQGDGGTGPAVQSVQPEFALYGVVSELRNRETSYFLFEFVLTNLKTREQIPLRPYEVKVARK